MSPQFNNMNDLVAYLDSLEKRIQTLERENQSLVSQKESLTRYIQELGGDAQKMLPKTSLLSPSFLQRAFTVWGHNFVAQMIISIPILCIYFIAIYMMIQQGLPIIPTP
ncbi:MAG: hypothetical protein AB1531_00280 [Chloroflexota bacterium]